MRFFRMRTLPLSCSLLVLSAAVPAAFADAEPDAQALAESAPPSAATADTPIAEIVVTAQKREEKLQEVPIAVTVVRQEQLQQQGVASIQDLTRVAPAIEAYGQPGNPDTRISIRGISTNSFSQTAEQAVSFVADGVVLGRAPSFSLFDIAQVEVLRGPQGTLFGKNASAGVVNIVTNRPDPTQFGVDAHVDLGNEWDYRLVQATVNVPLADTAAVRVSAGQQYSSGFIRNVVRDQDSESNVQGARARLLWDITPDLSLNVIADYDKQQNSEQLYLQFERYELPYTPGRDPIPLCNGTYASPDNRIACGSKPSEYNGESWGFSAQFDYAMGDYTLTSISAYRRYLQDGGLDVDGTPLDLYDNGNVFDNKVYTQEFRIASPAGETFEYVAGVYGSKTEVFNYLTQNIGAALLGFTLGNPNEYDADMSSIAAFGQLTWHVDEQLRLIGGLRATRDKVEMTSQSFLSTPFFNGPLNAPISGDDSVNNLSWKIGGQFDIDKSMMAYITASRGYKGPQIVFNPPDALAAAGGVITPASISVVSPEYPMDYEAGIKSSWFHGALIANLNLFHTRIKDYQSSVFNAQGSSTPNNIDHVVTKGVEFDLLGMLYPGLTISGGAVYNKATYPEYYVTCTAVNPGPQCTPNAAGTLVENVAGDQLVGAPKWKITFATNYEHGLPFLGLSGFVGADVVYRSAITFNAGSDPRNTTGEHAIVGARLGLRQAEQGWSVALFARNLFDERYPQFLYAPYLFSQYSAPGGDASGHALSTESFRMFGLTLDYKF
jgi:iron complex outermembrane receptor protein